MSIFDKRMGKEKKASFELAEDSRQSEWSSPSFVANLFIGKFPWELIHPFKEQAKKDKEEGDRYLEKLEKFLKDNLDPDEVDETREIPHKVIKGLFEMGAFAIKIPKEYGGLGMSQVNYDRAVHLVGSYCGSTAALLSAHQSIGVPQPLISFGTEEQKRKFLPRFSKDSISGFALTEPDVGSDPRSMKTTATPTKDGKHYIINGEKLWCTNGNIADILVVMAQTPPKRVRGKEKKQISAFIVETNSPGFEVTYRCKFVGLNAIQNGLLRFNNVKVPKENILIGEGQGLKLAFITLNTGRLTLPAAVTGTSKWCLNICRSWALERKQWGVPIAEHEAVASKISTMASTIFAMETMTFLVAHMADLKSYDIRLEAAIAKLFCTEESWKIIYEAIQIRGGRGYETAPSLRGRGKPAYALERAMRDGRVNTILEGSSEIMHLFIAREAMDFHLEPMKQIYDPRISIGKKIKIAFKATLAYALWYPKLWLPTSPFAKEVKAKSLKKHIVYMKKTSKRLAREMFHKMMIHQKKLASKQGILNRFVDIGLDLFAMACACSWADTLSSKNSDESNSVELADLFSQEAEFRINTKFRELKHNSDKLSTKVAKNTMAGNYDWLESDIIKPCKK